MPKTLVSDYSPEFVSGDLKKWGQSLGIQKLGSPVYHPIANGLSERAVQSVKHQVPILMCHSEHSCKRQ